MVETKHFFSENPEFSKDTSRILPHFQAVLVKTGGNSKLKKEVHFHGDLERGFFLGSHV